MGGDGADTLGAEVGGDGAGIEADGVEVDRDGTELDGALGAVFEPDTGDGDLLANEVNRSEIVLA